MDRGVKTVQGVHRRDILEAVVLTWAAALRKGAVDGRRARKRRAIPISGTGVWFILEGRVWAKRHHSLDFLKESVRWKWNRLFPDELRHIAETSTKRLDPCIRSKWCTSNPVEHCVA